MANERKNRQVGFSLMELLAALFVFSLLSGFAYQAVNALSEARNATQLEESELGRLQQGVLLIGRDVREAIKIEVGVPNGNGADKLKSVESLLLISAGKAYTSRQEQGVRQMKYSLRNTTVYRESWLHNKSANPPQPTNKLSSMAIFNNIRSLSFTALLNQNGDAINGIKVIIDHASFGEISKIMKISIDQLSEEDLALNTLTPVVLAPTTVGGQIQGQENIVLDSADVVVSDW